MEKENRFSGFTDAEIYMIQKAFVEASGSIMNNPIYNKEEKDLFEQLLNEFHEEDANRIYNRKEN